MDSTQERFDDIFAFARKRNVVKKEQCEHKEIEREEYVEKNAEMIEHRVLDVKGGRAYHKKHRQRFGQKVVGEKCVTKQKECKLPAIMQVWQDADIGDDGENEA